MTGGKEGESSSMTMRGALSKQKKEVGRVGSRPENRSEAQEKKEMPCREDIARCRSIQSGGTKHRGCGKP